MYAEPLLLDEPPSTVRDFAFVFVAILDLHEHDPRNCREMHGMRGEN